MAPKTAAKPAAKAAAAKPAAKAKRAPARRPAKGDIYECGVCGIVMTVDTACGCVEAHEIICCEQPMTLKEKKIKVK